DKGRQKLWKFACLHMFRMKHRPDTHFLLLVILHLLGAVTSQVNPAPFIFSSTMTSIKPTYCSHHHVYSGVGEFRE
ncbi:hypothetical protein AMECASPLE_015823, partial [Ameca splendens]